MADDQFHRLSQAERDTVALSIRAALTNSG
jgi:hypothetical protein